MSKCVKYESETEHTHKISKSGIITGHQTIEDSFPVGQAAAIELEEGRIQQQVQGVFAPCLSSILSEEMDNFVYLVCGWSLFVLMNTFKKTKTIIFCYSTDWIGGITGYD